jgi:hypothetical protein
LEEAAALLVRESRRRRARAARARAARAGERTNGGGEEMGNRMSLDEQLRQNKRTVNKAIRELRWVPRAAGKRYEVRTNEHECGVYSREQAQLEREKVRLEREIKKLAYVHGDRLCCFLMRRARPTCRGHVPR